MKLHDLKPNKDATKNRKRVGRGRASGYGKTAGRGTKGQKSRSGGGVPLWHQGGDTPFFRRLPQKPGFTPPNRVEYQEVNLEYLALFPENTEVTLELLQEVQLISKAKKPVVILGRGEIEVPLKVHAHRFTKSARAKIEAAGGSVEIVEP
ncbi:MAG: 50S ribosomal protein L15 [Chloroflexota bacterium]|nr:MAG: 50S ribosomal protein L15 [Chloroflexota bacterium]